MWSAGDSFALPFSERAVQAGAETTLTLMLRGALAGPASAETLTTCPVRLKADTTRAEEA